MRIDDASRHAAERSAACSAPTRPSRSAASSAPIVEVVRSSGCGVGVPQLHELHHPLDVGETAVAELEVRLAVGAAGQPLGLHPGLERADLAHLTVVEPALRASGSGAMSAR